MKKNIYLIRGVYGILLMLLVAVLFHRLRISAPFLDEIFFIAEPYQFAWGARPFADGVTMMQGSSVFLVPYMWLYGMFNSDYEGVVLFTRYFFVAVKLIITVLGILVLSRKMKLGNAAYVLLPLMFFFVGSFASFSYDTMSLEYSCLGLMIIFVADTFANKRTPYILAGICHAIAVAIYPPYVIMALLNIPLLYMATRKTDICKRAVITYSVTGVGTVSAMGVLLIIWGGGFAPFIRFVQSIFLSSYNDVKPKGSMLVNSVISVIIKHKMIAIALLMLAAIGVVIYFVALRKVVQKYAHIFLAVGFGLVSIAMFFLIPMRPGSYYYIYHIIIVGLCTVAMIYFKRYEVLYCFVIPTVAMVIIRNAFSATTNIFAQFIAFAPCLVGLMYIIYEELQSKQKNKALSELFLAMVSILSASVLLFAFYMFVNRYNYKIYSVAEHTVRIDSGIYKGLYETPDKAKGIEVLQQQIQDNSDASKTLMVANKFPPAYIMSGMKPATPNTYDVFYGIDDMRLFDLYYEHHTLPDMMFIVLSDGGWWDFDSNIHKFIEQNYECTFSDDGTLYPLYVYSKRT